MSVNTKVYYLNVTSYDLLIYMKYEHLNNENYNIIQKVLEEDE